MKEGRLQLEFSRIKDYQPQKNKASLVQQIIQQIE